MCILITYFYIVIIVNSLSRFLVFVLICYRTEMIIHIINQFLLKTSITNEFCSSTLINKNFAMSTEGRGVLHKNIVTF